MLKNPISAIKSGAKSEALDSGFDVKMLSAEFADESQENKPKINVVAAAGYYVNLPALGFYLSRFDKLGIPKKEYDRSGLPTIYWAVAGGSVHAFALLIINGYDVAAFKGQHLNEITRTPANQDLCSLMQSYLQKTAGYVPPQARKEPRTPFSFIDTFGSFSFLNRSKGKATPKAEDNLNKLLEAVKKQLSLQNPQLTPEQVETQTKKLLHLDKVPVLQP